MDKDDYEEIIFGLRLDIDELKQEIETLRQRLWEYERIERGWGACG